jgi:hypothetical protein
MSKVISFRASGHFLDWLETQRMQEESLSQCCQRMLRVMSTGGELGLSTDLSTSVSTSSASSLASTDLSTNIAETVDTQIAKKLEPVLARFAAIEERLGKLRA